MRDERFPEQDENLYLCIHLRVSVCFANLSDAEARALAAQQEAESSNNNNNDDTNNEGKDGGGAAAAAEE